MKNGTATTYYVALPDRFSFLEKVNLLRRVDYWKIVPILKLIHRRRYQKEAALLIESGLVQSLRGSVPVRYVIKNKTSRFDISPDQGKTYLNYLRGKLSDNSKEDLIDIVNAIATIEARIKTKAYKIY
jgi:hypothetical protein